MPLFIDRRYGAATHVYMPIVKRSVKDFAVGADWTPATGDVTISKDGATPGNIGTLPTAITAGNSAFWHFTLTATEMQGGQVLVMIADAATEAVEDDFICISTYGHQSAVHHFATLSAYEFTMYASSDHVTPATGLTVTAQRSIDGGAFAACSNSVSEVGSGVYKIDLIANDLNGVVVTYKFTATGADPVMATMLLT